MKLIFKRKDRKNKLFSLFVLVVLSLSFCLTDISALVAYADKISDLESKIREIKEKSVETKNQINESKVELDGLYDKADSLKEVLQVLNKEFEDICSNLEKIEEDISTKNEEVDGLEKALAQANMLAAEQYAVMKKRIQYMYEQKGTTATESFVGVKTFGDYLNRSNYVEAITTYDRNMLEKFAKTCTVIEDAKATLEDEKKQLSVLKKEAKKQQNRVNGLMERTNLSIKKYEAEIEATENEILIKEDEFKKQQSDIATLRTQLEKEKKITDLAGQTKWSDISQVNYADGDRKLLANIIYCEAGNQSYEGQLAVGAVVMNRVKSSVFPNTIVGVVYQSGQFTPAQSGRLSLALANDQATESCYRAADAAMAGQNNVGNCLFFRTPIAGLNGIRIGDHIFY